MKKKDKAERDFELQKAADELEAAKYLFNDDDDERHLYKRKLEKKRLRKLLNEE